MSHQASVGHTWATSYYPLFMRRINSNSHSEFIIVDFMYCNGSLRTQTSVHLWNSVWRTTRLNKEVVFNDVTLANICLDETVGSEGEEEAPGASLQVLLLPSKYSFTLYAGYRRSCSWVSCIHFVCIFVGFQRACGGVPQRSKRSSATTNRGGSRKSM